MLKSTIRRLLVCSVVTVAGAGLTAAPASAAEVVHVRLPVVTVAGDVPAGVLCDFEYHEEDTFTQNVTRFFDDAGHLVRVEDEVDTTILHRNNDTGATLVERLHYAAHVDLVDFVVDQTGQSWNLRDSDGRVVLASGGVVTIDILTGEVVAQTPAADADTATTLCPLLGGAPAS